MSAWPFHPADSDAENYDRLRDQLVDPDDEHLNGDWWGEPVTSAPRAVLNKLQELAADNPPAASHTGPGTPGVHVPFEPASRQPSSSGRGVGSGTPSFNEPQPERGTARAA